MDDRELEKLASQIVVFFEGQSGEDYWKTLEEISRGTGFDTSTVTKIINLSGDFVRSSYRLRAGEPLFTTRKNFRDKAPFVDKIIGAFKNRID